MLNVTNIQLRVVWWGKRVKLLVGLSANVSFDRVKVRGWEGWFMLQSWAELDLKLPRTELTQRVYVVKSRLFREWAIG
jgi:hypothetical protein